MPKVFTNQMNSNLIAVIWNYLNSKTSWNSSWGKTKLWVLYQYINKKKLAENATNFVWIFHSRTVNIAYASIIACVNSESMPLNNIIITIMLYIYTYISYTYIHIYIYIYIWSKMGLQIFSNSFLKSKWKEAQINLITKDKS